MKVSILGREVELQQNPIGTFPEYAVYETSDGGIVHLDSNGEPIIYTSYVGYQFGLMHKMNAFISDLGDRIEIQKYVGGTYHWYRYHIDKKTRRAIAYFESKDELGEDEVDTSMFRVWSSADLGEYLYISGIGNGAKLIHKIDGTDITLVDPDGVQVSKIQGVYEFNKGHVAVHSSKGQFHVDISTLEPVTYTQLETGEKLSYFDRTEVDSNAVWVRKGWRKYLVNPATKSIVTEKLDWVPRVIKLLAILIGLGIIGLYIYVRYFYK